jgi:hypothetical protein
MDTSELTIAVLMYFVLPVWLAAGFADYLCHRASNIATTSGPKESLLHLLQFAEMAVAVLAALFLEINALVLLIMLVCFVLHEATALWDLSYASARREVTPIEQHVHSFLEMMPLMSFVLIAVLNWAQFLALFGLGHEPALQHHASVGATLVDLRHRHDGARAPLRGASLSGGIAPRS